MGSPFYEVLTNKLTLDFLQLKFSFDLWLKIINKMADFRKTFANNLIIEEASFDFTIARSKFLEIEILIENPAILIEGIFT